jgi:starch synthase
MNKSTPLKILFASSEVAPFAKTGGLADVSSSLPAALASLGHQVVVVMPLYRSVMEGPYELNSIEGALEVPYRGRVLKDKVFYSGLEPNLSVYFIRKNEFFDRSMLYSTPEGDYFDNADRFIYFSRGILNLSKLIDFKPDIIHCNDWQTSLVPSYLKSLYMYDTFFEGVRTILTIHNLAYQGIFPAEYMAVSGLPAEFYSLSGFEYYGKMNFLKGGIVFADIITTVSEKYSLEIQTSEFGYGLEGILKERSSDVHGVLNGVDYREWNPETDSHIIANYNEKDLSGKKRCKKDLIKSFKLKGSEKAPLIGIVSRLAAQKGFDILAEAVDKLVELGFLMVLLGTGDEIYEKQFAEIRKKHKGRFGVKIAFDNALAHKIEAGADMFLMPSRYEPCGLNQMYSLKYGTIPVVRATGGLDDTIKEFDNKTKKGNGFKFAEYSSQALIKEMQRALEVYSRQERWLKLVKNGMREDFSWERSARTYEKIYHEALARR